MNTLKKRIPWYFGILRWSGDGILYFHFSIKHHEYFVSLSYAMEKKEWKKFCWQKWYSLKVNFDWQFSNRKWFTISISIKKSSITSPQFFFFLSYYKSCVTRYFSFLHLRLIGNESHYVFKILYFSNDIWIERVKWHSAFHMPYIS